MKAEAGGAEELVRACRFCNVEKPMRDFGIMQRWHLRVCKRCRYSQRANVLIGRSRNYYTNQRDDNLKTHGTACTPARLQEVREKARAIRARNKGLYSYAYSPNEREKRRRAFAEQRTKALGYYGGKCACCGESRYNMLTFHHLSGNGHKADTRGVKLVYDAIRQYQEHGYPNGRYQVLCWNCNMSRGFYKYCPHQPNGESYDYLGKQTKLEIIEAYGGRCALCGESHWEFLTIDHINGGGAVHRRTTGGGAGLYRMLKKYGWPKDDYRLLCSNCNCSKKQNRWSQKGVEA